jgi:hypothetical protein
MTKEIERIESNNFAFPFAINKDIDILIPKDQRKSFQKSFAYLRKKLQIKPTRKTYIDSILKKCKARFFKAINDCLNKCLKKHISKFPQSFITDISIESNKWLIDLTVREIYQYFILSNKNCMEFCFENNICYEGKEKLLKVILYNKISDLYQLYIKSKRYQREIQSIKKSSGLKMSLLYIFVSENFINYYLFSKPHLCKRLKRKTINNDNNKINISNNNSNFGEVKKSTFISLFIDNSENIKVLNDSQKENNDSNIVNESSTIKCIKNKIGKEF